MLSVNKDLYKSSSIDGASKSVQFFKITLPSINSTINFLVTIGIIGSIKIFPLALFNNNVDLAENHNGMTLMLLIFKFVNQGLTTANLGAASAIVIFLIGMVVSALLNLCVKTVVRCSIKIGELRVKTKIKNSKLLYQ